jgi:fatty acyl-CoA reductase
MEVDLSKYIRKKTPRDLLDENNNLEDFAKNPNIKTRCIKEFFDNCNVFVTGSTGFLGKVLIEKLLRTCDGIEKIYILLRPKRGVGSEQRFEEYLRNPIFERIRMKNPEILNKLVCIPGDIKDPNIGLGDSDAKLLENVDIVFHVAATVRFNEPLRDAANLNTFGTRRIMELCTKMKKLKVCAIFKCCKYFCPYLRLLIIF